MVKIESVTESVFVKLVVFPIIVIINGSDGVCAGVCFW